MKKIRYTHKEIGFTRDGATGRKGMWPNRAKGNERVKLFPIKITEETTQPMKRQRKEETLKLVYINGLLTYSIGFRTT